LYLGSDYSHSQQQWVSSPILVDFNMTEDRKSWSRCTIGTNRLGMSKRKSRLLNSCHIPMGSGCESAFSDDSIPDKGVRTRGGSEEDEDPLESASDTDDEDQDEESEGEESGRSSEEEEEEESDDGAPPPPSRSPSPELSSDSDSSPSMSPLHVPEKTPLPRTEDPESYKPQNGCCRVRLRVHALKSMDKG